MDKHRLRSARTLFSARIHAAILVACAVLVLRSAGNGADCPDQLRGCECLVPACLLGLDWERGPACALVVEKTSQTISVYEWNKGGITLK
ncbi:MAG: hypothetical protein JRI36_10090, partial [Deltaproteobacteria bacterium]|nr:hypothetical protein [Deltaproteobacteria bacterium]